MDLSAFFQTKLQASDFSSRLASLSEQIYETDFNLESALLEQFGLKKKDQFMALLRDQKVSIDSNTALKKFLTDVQTAITSLPVLTLTLAFDPKEKTLKALSEWFVINLKQQVLFEIRVDPSLIAGASISFKGRDADFSIKSKFEQTLQELLQPPAPQQSAPADQTNTRAEPEQHGSI